jgi:hypothetical protein
MDYVFDPVTGAITANPARIEAAFKVTAIDALKLDVGLKIPLPIKEEDFGITITAQDNFKLAAVATFESGDFAVTAGLYGGFGGSIRTDVAGNSRWDEAATFNITVGPSFYLAGLDATVGADLGFKIVGDADYASVLPTLGVITGGPPTNDLASTDFGLAAWITKSLGAGMIKTGVSFVFPTYKDNTAGTAGYLSWPIIMEIAF